MDEKYVDPVCGMEITAEEAADSVAEPHSKLPRNGMSVP